MEELPQKIKSVEELAKRCAALRAAGKKVVMCHGVFDLVHLGHIRHLNSAKKYGDVLIVTITADRHVKRGPGRPIFKQDFRAEALANLAVVDYVGIVEYPSAVEAIQTIKPSFYVKGPDYSNKGNDVTGKIDEEEAAVRGGGGELVVTEDITFSSSKLINSYLDTYPEQTAQYLRKMGKRYQSTEILEVLKPLESMRVLVIGDTIIDQYHYCSALGKATKENIVVNKYLSEEDFAGGSLATANHLAQLCHQVDLVTVLGSVKSYEEFIRGKLSPYIKPTFSFRPGCVTTIKRRYVGENSQKLFEVCFLDDSPLPEPVEREILDCLEYQIADYDLVVVSDFGHGMMTQKIMDLLCEKARCLAVNAQTNSANWGFNLVTKYSRADLICIDERELRLAAHDKYGSINSLIEKISADLDAKMVISTRGEHGSISYSRENGFHEAPALTNNSRDKMGAGDAFFAYVSPCFAAGVSQELLNFVGNATGALAVNIIGNREPVQYADFMKFVTRLLKI